MEQIKAYAEVDVYSNGKIRFDENSQAKIYLTQKAAKLSGRYHHDVPLIPIVITYKLK